MRVAKDIQQTIIAKLFLLGILGFVKTIGIDE